jgi:hypothetical protein
MASQSESGHAKNVANFKELITVLNSFGGQYNPTVEDLKAESLLKQASKAEDVLNKLKELGVAAKQATSKLKESFQTLNTLTSQALGFLISTRASASTIESARTVQRLITGANAKKRKTEEFIGISEEDKGSRSKSRQSYDSRLDNFEKLVVLLSNTIEYAPNEEALKVETLQKKALEMKNAVEESDKRSVEYTNMMHERNELIYNKDVGLVATALRVRSYIKAVFGGAKSKQYQMVCKVKISYR